MIKLGLVGCGNISKFHIPAFQKAGFSITAISGRNNSNDKLSKFSKENKISNAKIFSNSLELINSNIWDALLICCPTENSLEYLKIASNYKKPILVEKPISHHSNDLLPLLKYENIKVAFNRRFYKSVKFAKKFYNSSDVSLIKVSIPEKNNNTIKSRLFPSSIYENSIHIFDLLNFILNDYKFNYCDSLINQKKYRTIIASGTSKKGSFIQLNICFNSSDNFSIDFVSDRQRLELRPIEIARLYNGIRSIDPTKKIPIRRYNPIIQCEVISDCKNNLKPGFYEQAQDFSKFCKGKPHQGATIKDAYNNLKLIEQLFNLQKN
jgi:predicted dehydrogenase